MPRPPPSSLPDPVRQRFLARTARTVACALLLLTSGPAQGQPGGAVVGTVTAERSGAPIGPAEVTLFEAGSRHALTSTTADAAGRFRLAEVARGTYRVAVRALGYRTAQRAVTVQAAGAHRLDVVLQAASSGPEAVVTTPSRRPEAVRHAPASVTTVGEEAVQRAAAVSPVAMLRGVAGLHAARTGLDRYQLAVPGVSGPFSREPLVLVDDRPAGLPALGANVFALMPIQPVDVKRVEVVRSPSVALYGPEAAAGVVHVITKDPFEAPGTTAAVTGGPHPFMSGQFRHAAAIGATFGYEVVAHGMRGVGETLDRADPAEQPWLAYDAVLDAPDSRLAGQRVDPATGQLRRDGRYWTAGIRGRFAYRLRPRATIAVQGGYASTTGPLLSDLGTLQARHLGYSFGQVRVQAGGLFAQVVLNNNEAGASYLYGTGQAVIDRSVAYGAQLRYRFEVPRWATAFTAGADGQWTRPRTDGTLMGRHEEHDGVDRYGAYGAARTALSPRLRLALAVRADVDARRQTVWPAARAAAMYDLAPAHTMRLRIERAAAALEPRTRLLDMTAWRQGVGGPYALAYRVQGVSERITFDRFRRRGRALSLLPRAGHFGQPFAVSDILLQTPYEIAAARFDRLLADPATQPAPVRRLSAAQVSQLATTLRGLAGGLGLQDRTAGTLGVPDGAGAVRPVGLPRDVAPLARPIVRTIALGYHGRLGDRVSIAANATWSATKNAVRPAAVATPLVYATRLERDLAVTLAPLIAQQAAPPDAPLGDLLDAMALDAAGAARLAANLVGQAFEGVPVGVVPPDQALTRADASAVERSALVAYRNAARTQHVGADVSVQLDAHAAVDLTGGLSVVHPVLSPDADGAAGRALNAPRLQAHLRVDADVTAAWALHLSGHYASSFPARAGGYAGTVAARYPVDAGLRYDAQRLVPGLRATLTVRNVLNQARREFVGAPAIGRRALLRLTYAL